MTNSLQFKRKPVLIFSGGGSRKHYEIATKYGFQYGAQLPDTIYGKLYFADHEWKNPRKDIYIKALCQHKPNMATVLDWVEGVDLSTILLWAEEISQYVNKILIVPKIPQTIKHLPKSINSKEVILAYSIPSSYGKTKVSIYEFKGWPIHLLGGSPRKQFKMWKIFSEFSEVSSIDGNYFMLKANKFCQHWELDGRWVSDNFQNSKDAHFTSFEKSCKNLKIFWENVFIDNYSIFE